MIIQGKNYRTVWMEGSTIKMINQPLLPHKFDIVDLNDYKQVHNAIKNMITRGAPAIGGTAALGVAQAIIQFKGSHLENFDAYIKPILKHIQDSRPTAYDIFYGSNFVMKKIKGFTDIEKIKKTAQIAAEEYCNLSVAACRAIGKFGNELIKEGDGILTHCNAGALATVDYGTALAPIRSAKEAGKEIFVFADETRPRSQGSRLTAFELSEEGIPHAIIVDNAAGYYMKKGDIQLCIVGSDRTASNGDVANKIGTYEKAVVAHELEIPFYVAIPTSTVDFDCPTGDDIPIEERDQDEVLYSYGWNKDGKFDRVRISPNNSQAKNPAFDVTPAKYVTGYITPIGVLKASELHKLKE